MTELEKNKIKDILYEVFEQVDKCPSIAEKKNKYYEILRYYDGYNLLPFKVDFNSQELEELITNNFLNISIVKPQIFVDDGYHPWLEKESKNIAWEYKKRFLKYLLKKKHWTLGNVANIDKVSDIILDHVANPKDERYFNVRGLVMGDIQSGKTANYTALINKAIDAGYKIIIILAGLTKELRNQTQKRLDLEVIGRVTSGPKTGTSVGVGEFGSTSFKVEPITCTDDEKGYGELHKFFTQHILDENLTPVIAIVKKNTSVLSNLYKFLTKSDEDCYEDRKLKIPVMIIDDEVDQASVDTKGGVNLSEASATNRWIRTIISSLNRCSYVGYTATPFANVFIDADKENDLYPKDFILYMPPSKGYCGIKEYFGVDIEDDKDENADHSNDLFREIKDKEYYSLYGKNNIKVDTDTLKLNESMQKAIRSYILSCAIKKSRNIFGPNSMLIHVARYKNPSTTLKPLVEQFIGSLSLDISFKYKKEIQVYKDLWENDFKPVSQQRLGSRFNDQWEKISNYIEPTINSIKLGRIKVLNGDSDDVLDYSSGSDGDYIVIGGDKLSRGLTLEGLTVSYYWRRSRNYDSLLQMARWFGYRNGWIDVCRIYTSNAFLKDFITVGKVLERFKLDLTNMYNENLNPRDVGQRIMYSSNLLPTSRNKMRNVTKLKVSFSNEIQQIITFDRKLIPSNFDYTLSYINNVLGEPTYVIGSSGKLVYKNVGVEKILTYLNGYKECGSYYEYGQINIKNWISYIENLVAKGELKTWTVVVSSISGNENKENKKIPVLGGKYNVYKRERILRDVGPAEEMNHYTVRVVTDPSDFKEALDRGTKEYEETELYDKTRSYKSFTSKNGLLALYIFDLYEREFDCYKDGKMKTKRSEQPVSDGLNVCSPAIWFSKTEDYESSAVGYYVNKDYLDNNNEEDLDDDNQ